MCRKTRRPLRDQEVDRQAVEVRQRIKLTCTNGQEQTIKNRHYHTVSLYDREVVWENLFACQSAFETKNFLVI